MDDALLHFDKTIPYLKTTRHCRLYEVYNLISVIYKIKGNESKYQEYKDKAFDLRAYITAEEFSTARAVFDGLESKRKTAEIKSKNTRYTLFGAILGAVFIATSYHFYSKSQLKKQKSAFDKITKEIKLDTSSEEISNGNGNGIDLGKPQISDELEKQLLVNLDKFEKSSKFTDPNMSLASLASIVGTNTQYLSKTINKHKGKNFNNYVNELRVNFIIRKLLTDEKYSAYKISYLAKEAGFSSHSAFTKIFKEITKLSPSEFISLQEQKRNS